MLSKTFIDMNTNYYAGASSVKCHRPLPEGQDLRGTLIRDSFDFETFIVMYAITTPAKGGLRK